MNTNATKIIFYIKIGVLFMGVAFLCGVVMVVVQTVHKSKTYERAEGIVTELVRKDNYYYPVVTFTTLAQEEIVYASRSAQNPPTHREGSKVHVAYDPENPYKVMISNSSDKWGTIIILSIIGLICTGLGVVMVRGDIIWAHNKKKLLQINYVLKSKSISIEKNNAISFNDNTPWVVYATITHPLDSQIHRYQSKNIWFDPTEFIAKEIDVYIDPENPAIGYVDVDIKS